MSQETIHSKGETHSIITKILSFPLACLAIIDVFSLSYKEQSTKFCELKACNTKSQGTCKILLIEVYNLALPLSIYFLE